MNDFNNNENITLPTFEFDVSIGTKSIIYLALAIIVSSLIVILIARMTKSK
jgi:hypothetical protein